MDEQCNKKTELERSASERNYEELVEKAGSIILCIDRKGLITFANTYAQTFFGYEAERLVGRSVFDTIIPPQSHNEDIANLIQEILKKPEQYKYVEHQNMRSDGSLVSIAWNNELLGKAADENVEILAVGIDISDRVKAESAKNEILIELQESRDALEQFVRIAAHDLQEPLRAIASYVQLLERRYRGKLDPDADLFIGYAVSGVNRIQALLKDLLVYSFVENERRPLQTMESEGAFLHAVHLLNDMIKTKKAEITHDTLPTIRGDPRQITQLFQHLLQNAVTFCDKPKAKIHVSAAPAQSGYDKKIWEFSVSDNGIGIEVQYWDEIFRIFRRLHSSEKFPGTGIGLAICERIVKRHAGRIWLKSRPGEGSTFFFTLPAVVEEKDSNS